MNGGPVRLLGAVLAGGESRRFGADKGSELIAGITLVERAARTLDEVFSEVVIVTALGDAGGRPTVADLRLGCGPLAGLEAALHAAAGARLHGVFVLACDLPLVTADAVRTIASRLDDADAAAPRRGGAPPIEPLCAAYRTTCLPVVTGLLDAGERAAHVVFDSVDGVVVPDSGADFLNVNTREDGRRAEAALATRSP